MSKSTFDKAITPMQAARVLYRMNATEIPEAKLQQMATKRRGAVLALRRKQAELEKGRQGSRRWRLRQHGHRP
jgi:hypothetical protein